MNGPPEEVTNDEEILNSAEVVTSSEAGGLAGNVTDTGADAQEAGIPSPAETVIGFNASSLQNAASEVDESDVVDLLRGDDGIYRRFDIPDTADQPISDGSWRSWEDSRGREGRGVGGGWYISEKVLPNGMVVPARWIDFWRSASDRPQAAASPIIYQLIEQLQDGSQQAATNVFNQLAQVALRAGHLDIGLTLAVTEREFTQSRLFGQPRWIDSYHQGGLDFLGDYQDENGERHSGELVRLKHAGYLRSDFPTRTPAPPEVPIGERGRAAYPVWLRTDTLIEVTAAVLKLRRDLFFREMQNAGYDIENLSLTAYRAWTVLAFGGLGDARRILRELGPPGTDLNALIERRSLQNWDDVKRALISTGEAIILDELLLTRAEELFDASRGMPPFP